MSVGAFYGTALPAWGANAPLEIPVTPNGVAWFTFAITLDGKDYTFGIKYTAREDRWYLTILDANRQVLVGGIKLIADWALLRRFGHVEGIMPGNLMVKDMSGAGEPPGLNDWGTRCRLFYWPVNA